MPVNEISSDIQVGAPGTQQIKQLNFQRLQDFLSFLSEVLEEDISLAPSAASLEEFIIALPDLVEARGSNNIPSWQTYTNAIAQTIDMVYAKYKDVEYTKFERKRFQTAMKTTWNPDALTKTTRLL